MFGPCSATRLEMLLLSMFRLNTWRKVRWPAWPWSTCWKTASLRQKALVLWAATFHESGWFSQTDAPRMTSPSTPRRPKKPVRPRMIITASVAQCLNQAVQQLSCDPTPVHVRRHHHVRGGCWKSGGRWAPWDRVWACGEAFLLHHWLHRHQHHCWKPQTQCLPR